MGLRSVCVKTYLLSRLGWLLVTRDAIFEHFRSFILRVQPRSSWARHGIVPRRRRRPIFSWLAGRQVFWRSLSMLDLLINHAEAAGKAS